MAVGRPPCIWSGAAGYTPAVEGPKSKSEVSRNHSYIGQDDQHPSNFPPILRLYPHPAPLEPTRQASSKNRLIIIPVWEVRWSLASINAWRHTSSRCALRGCSADCRTNRGMGRSTFPEQAIRSLQSISH